LLLPPLHLLHPVGHVFGGDLFPAHRGHFSPPPAGNRYRWKGRESGTPPLTGKITVNKAPSMYLTALLPLCKNRIMDGKLREKFVGDSTVDYTSYWLPASGGA